MWGISSAGRAPALHAGGQEFESPILHHKKPNDICYSVFYFAWVGFDEKLPMYKVHFKGVARVSWGWSAFAIGESPRSKTRNCRYTRANKTIPLVPNKRDFLYWESFLLHLGGLLTQWVRLPPSQNDTASMLKKYKKSAELNKDKWKNGKNFGKNSAKLAKIKFCYGTDGS